MFGRGAVPRLSTASLVLALALWGCNPEADTQVILLASGNRGSIEFSYPGEGTIFPPEIVAPTFRWEGAPGTDLWYVLTQDSTMAVLSRETVATPEWRPGHELWGALKTAGSVGDVTVTVAGVRRTSRSDVLSSGKIRIRTSKDPVGDALFYREVPLPFLTAVQDPSRIRWRFGTIDMEDGPPVVLQNLPVCGNCHSFSDDGTTLGLDVDYGNDKGAYGILPVSSHMVMDDAKIITWADYRREDGDVTFGLLSRMSPTGRYVVSTVKDRSVFVAMPDLMISQLFFPIKGILVVHDRETKTFTALPGADNPALVQTNATWSPDGEELVFARAKAHHAEHLNQQNNALLDQKDVPEFTVEGRPFRYDLYRIPFNSGRGGEATALTGASGNGKSNFFPKYSPDGKWIVFCQADSYMLLRPDSELYIVPAQGGTPRRLRHNTPRMNSWHSWSSNSRWLVFSSKWNGPFTQLFLTHIDEEGNDSPPVLLERFTSPDRAANIPEFVRLPGNAIAEIREQFLDPYSFFRAGMANQRTGDFKGAERAFRRGLDLAPNDPELRNSLGWTLFQEGRPDEAVAEFLHSLENKPDQPKTHNNLALALVELGRLEEAVGHFRSSLALEPRAEIHSDLGFALARMGQLADARSEYAKALEMDPSCASAHLNLAVDFIQQKEPVKAEVHYRKAIETRSSPETYNGLGYSLRLQDRLPEAEEAFRKAIELGPGYAPAFNNLGELLVRQRRFEEAETVYSKSLAIRPSQAVTNTLNAIRGRQGRPGG